MKNCNAQSWIAAALTLAGIATGCGSKTVDIGDDRDPALLGVNLSDYRGAWVGYAQLAEWSDGTSDLRIELDDQGNGGIEFGLATPLEPPIARDGYPRDYDIVGTGGGPLNVVSGFSYPIIGAVVESKRIRFGTKTTELYREYCELQTPMAVEGTETGFNCTGFFTYSVGGGPDCQPLAIDDSPVGPPIDCDWTMCLNMCICDANGCAVGDIDWRGAVKMDAALESEGEELVGSLEIPQGISEPRIYRVVMTRE